MHDSAVGLLSAFDALQTQFRCGARRGDTLSDGLATRFVELADGLFGLGFDGCGHGGSFAGEVKPVLERDTEVQLVC